MTTERSAGGPAAIAEAAALLATAKVPPLPSHPILQNPVIISGGGVVMGGGVQEVVALAEAIQVGRPAPP
jgi:thiamine pyrophosphate-dependent acetolactate synthase large subunit-like protein